MRKKNIKTFSVDADIYNELIAMFKRYEVDVSLSNYVDSCLKGLRKDLKNMEDIIVNNKDQYTVPMSYVIEDTIRSKSLNVQDNSDLEGGIIFDIADSWQEEYEARRKNVPVNIYRFIKCGYELSKDKKSLTRKDTGEKLIIVNGKVICQEDLLKMATVNKEDEE